MGEIFHEWNGTVLTITSDSGTSSADLKGAQGEMGVRGAQGAPGTVIDNTGDIEKITNKTNSIVNAADANTNYPTVAAVSEYVNTTLGGVEEKINKFENKASLIDLSAYEITGQIVETFADGTAKTTSLEFDANGNPIKITDRDGNVTELRW